MVNSGVADVAEYIIGLTDHYGPAVLLAAMFVITNLFTELITNNAAAALAFPFSTFRSSQLGVKSDAFLCGYLYGCIGNFLNTYYGEKTRA